MSKFVKYAVLLIAIMVALGACSPSEQAAPTAEKVSIRNQLGWVYDYSSAGFYMAIANGHYAEENLDVTLIPGGYTDKGLIDPVEAVVNGNADFGSASVTALIQAKAEGKPLVGVASITQLSPFAIISLDGSGITHPSDLVGKTVSINDGGARLTYDALLTEEKIDPTQVNTISRTSFGVDDLVNHTVDALGGWIINEGITLEGMGLKPHYMLLSDYAVDSYDFVIFTTEDMVKNHPDVVERFLRATFKGHQDVVDNPQKAVETTLTYDSSLSKDVQLQSLQALIPLMAPAGSHIGDMNADVWDFNYKLLQDSGTLSKPIDVKTVYDLSFLNKIYAK